jgi:hypothetical protein
MINVGKENSRSIALYYEAGDSKSERKSDQINGYTRVNKEGEYL